MVRRRWLLGAAVLFASLDVAVVACSSFTGSPSGDVDAGPDDAGGGGGGTDAVGPVDDAAPGTADAATNLLVNADFELPGCAGWSVGGGSANPASVSSVPNDGGTACSVCGTGNQAFKIYQRRALPLSPGETYAGSALIRAPDGGKIATMMQCGFIVYGPDGGVQRQTNAVPMSNEWSLAECAVIVRDAGTELELFIGSAGNGTGCFLVDDARASRKP